MMEEFCPNCEWDTPCMVDDTRPHEIDLTCLVCGHEFTITTYTTDEGKREAR